MRVRTHPSKDTTMNNLNSLSQDLATFVGQELERIYALEVGSRAAALTTSKGTIISMINELVTGLDAAKTTAAQALINAITALRVELTGGADEAHNTFKEIQDLLANNASLIDALNASSFVKFTAQVLTTAQQLIVRTNIDAASPDDVRDAVLPLSNSLSAAHTHIENVDNRLTALVGAAPATTLVATAKAAMPSRFAV
jgi:hypothetical protein